MGRPRRPPSPRACRPPSPDGISVSAHGEAPPVLQILPGGSLTVAYAAALPGKWKNEIRLQTSTDGGAHWSAAEHLHAERFGAHSYLSSTVTAAGEPVFAWLDDSTGQMGLHAKVGSAPPGGLYPRWAPGGDRAALAFTCPTQSGPQVVVTDWNLVLKESSKEGPAGFTCEGSSASHSGHAS